MTVVVRIIILLIGALAVFRFVYAIGSSERKAKMREAVDKVMAMLTTTVVIYWLYMGLIWFLRQRNQ